MVDDPDPITDRHRLAAVRRLGLLDGPPASDLKAIVQRAVEATRAPIGLISIVDEDRQFFAASAGTSDHYRAECETSLPRSLCRYVVANAAPLILHDARSDPDFQLHLAVTEGQIGAYAGYPIITEHGQAIGTICVLDHQPRQWQSDKLAVLAALATEIAELIARRNAEADQAAQSAGQIITGMSGLASVARYYFDQLDAYLAAVRLDVQNQDTTAHRSAIVAGEAALRRALDKDDSDFVPERALHDACRTYLDALDQRSRVSLQFRRDAVPYAEMEAAFLATHGAEDALRHALHNYETQLP